jgi:hypothetical protein
MEATGYTINWRNEGLSSLKQRGRQIYHVPFLRGRRRAYSLESPLQSRQFRLVSRAYGEDDNPTRKPD